MKPRRNLISFFVLGMGLLSISEAYAAEGMWQENGVVVCTASDNRDCLKAVNSSEGIIVAWLDARNGSYNIYSQKINNEGIPQWTANGRTICSSYNNVSSHQMISDGNNGAIVSWNDSLYNPNIYIQRINNLGTKQWAVNGVEVCVDASDQYGPSLTTDGNNGAIVAWQDMRNGKFDIYAQKVNQNGVAQWTANGLNVCSNVYDKFPSPELVSDGSGGAILAWNDARKGDNDIYVQRIDSAGTLQWTTEGAAICTEEHQQQSPRMIGDGANGAIVAWVDMRSGNEEIYAQKVDNVGSTQWTLNGVNTNTMATNYQLETDGNGGVIIVVKNSSGIVAQRINSEGEKIWGSGGIVLCDSTEAYPTNIHSDGYGGADIAWYDKRSGNFDIYMQRVNALGVPYWTTNGIEICNAANAQLSPLAIKDSTNGEFIIWLDQRNSTLDIYSQRLIRPKPKISGISSPAVQGGIYQAVIIGSCFSDSQGSVVGVKLTRTACVDITADNVETQDTTNATCDINLSSAEPGNWNVVLTDSIGQTSHESVALLVLQPTPTITETPTVSFTPTVTSTKTETHTATVTLTSTSTPSFTPSSSITPTVTSTMSCSLTATSTFIRTYTATVVDTSSATPTYSPTGTPTPGELQAIALTPGTQVIVVGEYTFVVDPQRGFVIYDITSPSQPQLIGLVPLSGKSWHMCIQDHYAYLVDEQSDFYIVDIKNPADPKEINHCRTMGDAMGIDVSGDYVYIADGTWGLSVYDVSLPQDVRYVKKHNTPWDAQDVSIKGITANVVGPQREIISIDISENRKITELEIGGYATPNPFLPTHGQKAFFNFKLGDVGSGFVIRIFDLRGQLQRTLITTREWDGRSDAGHLCEGGVYIYQIEAEGKRVNGKVVLVK